MRATDRVAITLSIGFVLGARGFILQPIVSLIRFS